MSRTTRNLWLSRFALFTAGTTLCLIGVGGLVTSHGAGMAVPDWPTSYGYNMFLFPPSFWIGGILYEHTHRLVASFVGLLTTILAVWLWLKESRRWLRWLGVMAFVAVVLQGVLGGLRVTLYKDEIGIFHAALAQLFLVLVSLIALATSRWWLENAKTDEAGVEATRGLRRGVVAVTTLVFLQLVLGATMRHQHAGLAIPDFPLAYGKIWPLLDAASLDTINRSRLDLRDFNPITAFQIALHMAHRIGAIMTLIAVGWFAWNVRQRFGRAASLSKLSASWAGLIAFQAILGAATVLSNKAADVATAHVVTGAGSLMLGAMVCAILFRPRSRAYKPEAWPLAANGPRQADSLCEAKSFLPSSRTAQ